MPVERKKVNKAADLFVIHLVKLQNDAVALNQEIPLDWLNDELKSCEYEVTPQRGTLKLDVLKTGKGVLVQGKVDVDVATECAVCLAPMSLRLDAPISAFLMPKPENAKDEDGLELTIEELEQEWYEGDTLILDSLVRDTIMLALPMNPKCQDRCPGLPSAALPRPTSSIDPRLLPLAELSTKKEK